MNTIIKTLLIANRGEIALRIIRTCRKMGIKSVVVHSAIDSKMPFVREADLAIQLEGTQLSETYLNIDKIIQAARISNADAIHPGYGFLSENAGFAKRVIKEGYTWVGPNPTSIEDMGLKVNAKAIAEAANVPTIPGYKGKDQDLSTLRNQALQIGFPVLLKASAGGGGKGMRIVHEEELLTAAIESAKREALNSFGDETLLIEKYFPSSRHIEIQIFGDKHGNAVYLMERECSIQRRYQKIVEESPSSVLSEYQRQEMGEAAVRLCKSIGYDNAGTVEFIYTSDNQFYFLEVNTRLQVEHPVTESILGLDLVEWQIKIAEGATLPLSQNEIKSKGYALELRLYAENPENNFLPSTGKIIDWNLPNIEGIRVDAGVENGVEISVYYDPMIAKIISHADNRYDAIRKMSYALGQLRCQGLKTNQRFLSTLISNPYFTKGDYDTHFLNDKFNIETNLLLTKKSKIEASLALLLFRWNQRKKGNNLLKGIKSGWRNNYYQEQKEIHINSDEIFEFDYKYQDNNEFEVRIDNQTYQLALKHYCSKEIRIAIDGIESTYFVATDANDNYFVHHPIDASLSIHVKSRYPEVVQAKMKGGYEAAMPGEIFKILVKEGEQVEEGNPLLILVSMKMENTIVASESGKIQEIYITEGETVQSGKLLLKIETELY